MVLESLGMICSLGELGISDSVVPKEFADGIQILPENAVPGEEVFSYLDLDDEIIELSITPKPCGCPFYAWGGSRSGSHL